ncbi:MAG: class I SAM-dependent methyltransferase [Flavobacteriales bacterium]|jgi:predicted SAM-dependent methyltransferase|nr:class I SAM-dependent methyltransferase [Flavobacteriales bacterium]
MKKIVKFALNTVPRPLLIRLSYVFKFFAPVIFKGDNVECPVCEKKFKKFLPYGYNEHQRDNVLCPYDLTLERHRLMWVYLKTKSNFFTDNLKVMHIAPEQCFYKTFRNQKNIDYTTGDLESPLADLHFDLHNIPLEDNQYDVIFCNHVMEHVDNDVQCMKELLRIMKPGGWGIFQVPIDTSRDTTYEDPSITDPKEREKHFGQYDHVRLYGSNYPNVLRSAGFEVEEYDFTKELDEETYQRYRFQKGEMLYIVRKK